MAIIDNYFLVHVLMPAAAKFAFVVSIVGVALGIGLAIRSSPVLGILGAMNRWVSTRRSFKWAAVPRDAGRVAYAYRRWIGPALVIGAVYSMIGLLGRFDAGGFVAALDTNLPHAPTTWIVESAMWFLVLGCAITIVIGTMLAFFPAVLGRLETQLNRWVSTRQIADGGDTIYRPLDNLVEAFPRTAGCAIAAISLIAAIESGTWLFARA